MLMWEIFAGRPPFDDRPHSDHLLFDIYKGLRPQILPNMPDDYAQMMQKCWDVDPSKRLTIREILRFADNKLKEIYEGTIDSNNNTNISSNSGGSSSHSPQVCRKHSSAYHTSRILNDEITKSKILKSNDGLFEWS